MLKTNIKIQNRFIFAIACFLASSVFLLSIHAKDIVRYTDITVAQRVGFSDISAKAAGELHNHIDKQMVKTFDKAQSGDAYIAYTRNRESMSMLHEEDPGLWGRFHEVILLWRVYASLPFALA